MSFLSVSAGRSRRGQPKTAALLVSVVLLVLSVPTFLFFVGWGIAHGIGAVVCSGYNFLSNDLCERWRFDPPPKGAVPLPAGWQVRSSDLSCGSGGCPTRVYVLEPPGESANPVRAYAGRLRQRDWIITRIDDGRSLYGRRGNLEMSVEQSERERHIRVLLSFVTDP